MQGEVVTLIIMSSLVLGLAFIMAFPEVLGELLMDTIDAWNDWVKRFNEGVSRSINRPKDDE